MKSRIYLLLVLGLLAPNGVSAESCVNPSESFELELRSVTRVDGTDPGPEIERWESEGSATVGFKEDSFEHEEGTVQFEYILKDGDLRIMLEEAS